MNLTTYEIEQLMRMTYNRKLSSSRKKDMLDKREHYASEPTSGCVTYRIRPTGAATK